MHDKLREFAQATNKYIEEISPGDKQSLGTVNWNNLMVIDVEFVLPLSGGEFYRVLVEEAYSLELERYLEEKLQRDYPEHNFIVTTEW